MIHMFAASGIPAESASKRLGITPDEASQLSGIVSKRAELFGTIELAAEIGALKSQLAALGSAPRPPSPIRRPFAIT